MHWRLFHDGRFGITRQFDWREQYTAPPIDASNRLPVERLGIRRFTLPNAMIDVSRRWPRLLYHAQ